MLINPFTPSEIASNPEDFFGRINEVKIVKQSIFKGSVAIRGPIGIGKSSLMAKINLVMEGFDSIEKSNSIICVGNKDIKSLDDSARLVLSSFIQIDEKQNKIKFKLGQIFEAESSELCRYFVEGRHLDILKRIVEDEYLNLFLKDKSLLIIAIDEVDKCPIPIAQLVRSICTHTQLLGINRIRFLIAGVSPYFQEMINEDQGVRRFFMIRLPYNRCQNQKLWTY